MQIQIQPDALTRLVQIGDEEVKKIYHSITSLAGLGICAVALFLNRRGRVRFAGFFLQTEGANYNFSPPGT